jgi:predicted dehydrogenase
MNIGIIGYGKMGRLRHTVLENTGSHRVVHVCDPVQTHGDFHHRYDHPIDFQDP